MSHKELWPIWYLRRLFCDACMRRLAYDAFVVRILLAFIGSSVFRLTFLLIDMDAVLVASVSMGKITMRVGDFYFPISIVGMAISLSSLQISVSILNTPFPFHLLKKTSHFLSKCSLVSMCTLCGGTLSLHCYVDVICVQGGAFFSWNDGLQTPCRPCISRLGDSFLAFFSIAFSSYFDFFYD